jgi:hypothetical protein
MDRTIRRTGKIEDQTGRPREDHMTKTLALAAALVLAAPLAASACPGAKATSASNGDYTPIATAQGPAAPPSDTK